MVTCMEPIREDSAMINRITLAVLALWLSWPGLIYAQDFYKGKTVRIIAAGAGTLIAAKYLHSSAKPDGLTFGIFNGGLILGRVLGLKGIDFDVRELEFIGVPVQDSTVCALRKESGVSNMDHWYASKTPIKLGGLGPGNSTSDTVRAIKATLDL